MIVSGIEKTERKIQPFNVWHKGKIIRFTKTLKEAQNALSSPGY